MKKIESLTEEQKALMTVWRDKWIDIGLSCEPLDLPKAKKAVRLAYKSAGMKCPRKFMVFDSPMSAALGLSILKNRDNSVGDSVRDSVGASVWASVGASVWASVGDSVRASVRASVRDSVWASVGASVWASVRDMIYGSHDAGWLSFYSYMRDVIVLKSQTEKIAGLIELANHCGWWSPYTNLVALQHRHCKLHRDARERLHNDSGMAVEYRDGWGVYAIHGTRVPSWIIEEPEKITPKAITDESNGEVRRAMMLKYGWHNLLRDVKAKMVDKDPDPTVGELWRWRDSDGVDIQVLKVKNGTPDPETGGNKWYSLRVPLEFKTAWEANRNSYPAVRHFSEREFREWNSARA